MKNRQVEILSHTSGDMCFGCVFLRSQFSNCREKLTAAITEKPANYLTPMKQFQISSLLSYLWQ